VIVYLDSSVLARSYLADEPGHDEAMLLLLDQDMPAITCTLTPLEVSGAIVRAARAGRAKRDGLNAEELLGLLDSDLGEGGLVTLVSAPAHEVEAAAMKIIRAHGLRAMDAWHLAAARLTAPGLAEPGEPIGFASRDEAQRAVAEELGFRPC
jgi:predicted nucleic acid-binding protein